MTKFDIKFNYLKPNTKLCIGEYAKYIATREGVDKIDYSAMHALTTLKATSIYFHVNQRFIEYKGDA